MFQRLYILKLIYNTKTTLYPIPNTPDRRRIKLLSEVPVVLLIISSPHEVAGLAFTIQSIVRYVNLLELCSDKYQFLNFPKYSC
jgi:hypothetical protein